MFIFLNFQDATNIKVSRREVSVGQSNLDFFMTVIHETEHVLMLVQYNIEIFVSNGNK